MKYIIIGAGQAGLSVACRMLERGQHNFIVLEKEKEVGGLCKSTGVAGSPFDFGGGHFLDIRSPLVNEFLFHYMSENEWMRYSRDSRIDLNGKIIGSPIEANIWMMDINTQIQYLKGIAEAGCVSGKPVPVKFTEWIFWKFGNRIAEDYMIPYNQKMFGENLDSLGTYWLEKLPDVSFEDTLRSCLEHQAYAKQPGHSEFLYPKRYGYGEVWKRMGEFLGDKIERGIEAGELDVGERSVNGKYKADVIINTAPWTTFRSIKGIDRSVSDSIKRLKYSSVVTEYYEETLNTKAQWIYCPDPDVDYHRILVRHNFCLNSKGYWTETNLTKYQESERLHFINEYAYPLNTIDKPETIYHILTEMKKNNIIGLGRWGEWMHYNSDVVVERAIALADSII